MLSQALAGTAKSARFCSGMDEKWRARQDSNLWPLPSEPQRILALIVVVDSLHYSYLSPALITFSVKM